MGEDRYRLLTNNCEHFCEWCLRGTARSFQVEAWLARPRLTLLATLRLIIRVPISSLLRDYATFIERFVPEKVPARRH